MVVPDVDVLLLAVQPMLLSQLKTFSQSSTFEPSPAVVEVANGLLAVAVGIMQLNTKLSSTFKASASDASCVI